MPNWPSVERILICRQDKLGDYLLATAVVSAVREAFPEAHIGLMVSAAHRELAELHPARPEVIVVPSRLKESQVPHYARLMRKGNWDAVLMLVSNQRVWSYCARLSGIPIRVGITHRWFGRFSTHLLDTYDMHEIQLALRAAGPALGRPLREHPSFFPDSSEIQAKAAEAVEGRSGFIAMALGTGGSVDPWPIEHWRELIQRTKLPTVLLGPPDQADLGQAVGQHAHVVNLIGQTDLLTLGGVMRRARLCVAGNTGLSHVAAACQIPVVVPETALSDRFWAMRWKPWMTASWHVYRDEWAQMPSVEAVETKIRHAWEATEPGADPEILERQRY